MRAIAGPMMIMGLIGGFVCGAGTSTLYWSSKMDRQFQAQKEWKSLVDKQSDTIKQQGDALRRLTAATDELLAATRPR